MNRPARLPPGDGFAAVSREALAAFLWWAAHFGVSYVFIAASCVSPLRDAAWGGVSVIRLGLLVMTLPLVAWLAWRAFAALHRPREEPPPASSLQRAARMASSLLALMAVAWTLIPMLVLRVCGA